MAMNSECPTCGHTPCQCHTTCRVPTKCIPLAKGNRSSSASIKIEEILNLIEEKCDKETCEAIQPEIDLLKSKVEKLYTALEVTDEEISDITFQKVSNMVDNLKDDLKDKYPSAELLKNELTALWECLYTKQEHHGDWKNNFTWRNVVLNEDDNCLLDGEKDNAPEKIKIITPVDVGSTVFHVIEGRRCLFESLIDNNTIEPSKKSVLEGKWINYCDIRDAIDCVLPRRIITDCHEECDDPNKDGVFEDKTICEQIEKINERLDIIETWIRDHE